MVTPSSLEDRAFCRNTPRLLCPCARVNGLGNHCRGTRRWLGGVDWPFCAVGQHSIGSNLTCVYTYVAAALRFPIDQAPAVTSTGIQLGTPGTRSICCILPVWRRWFLSAPGRFRLTCYSPNSRANARRPARLRLRGTHTDKAKGIGELQVPAEKRRLLRPFVKLLLASAELRDQHSLQACELLEELKQESPRNPLYEQELKNLKSKS